MNKRPQNAHSKRDIHRSPHRKSKELTDRQKMVFYFLAGYTAINGKAPTRTEIRQTFEFKSNRTARQYLEVLEDHGLIHVTSEERGIRIISQ